MSTPDEVTDDDVIAEWIREHPEVWAEASDPMSPAFVEGVIVDIVSGARMARLNERETRRHRNLVAGFVAALVVAGGAVGVAALVRSGQPTQPTAGVACREAPGVDADVIVIEPTDDPVGGCEAVWAAGRFSETPLSGGEAPALMACISDAGVIEVYPGDAETCTRLGLSNADPALDVENQAIVALQERLANEINLQPCVTAEDAAAIGLRIVEESGLAGWTVEIRTDSAGASCAKAAVDTTRQVVEVVKFP